MSDVWDDEDDEDILQLGDRPPMTQVALPEVPNEPNNDELIKAKGEAGVLRQKLSLLEKTLREHDENQRKVKHELTELHQAEVQSLKIELQRLEDERKFMILEQKHLFTPRQSNKTVSSDDKETSEHSTVNIKRRKVDVPKELISLLPNHKIQDDCSLFYDYFLSFRLPGVQHTVFEALDHICLDVTDLNLANDQAVLERRNPLGPFLKILIFKWKSVFSLDKLVDKTLEALAVMIQKISTSEETRYAIPFLISLMFATTTFRYSATRISSLKDVFQFITDLIISEPKFLKQSLHQNPLELDASPDVFQYSMIDQLCMVYSFDVLESCIAILLNCSKEDQSHFINDILVTENLTKCCNLTLSISYKPFFPVVVNTTEIILGLIDLEPIEPTWNESWSTIATKLLQIWEKPLQIDSQKFNFAGLIRCCGDNSNYGMLDRLIDFKDVRYLPMIIENEFPQMSLGGYENQEYWALQTQINITKIIQKLYKKFQSKLCSLGFLQKAFTIFSTQHELLLTVLLGKDSRNDVKRQQLLTVLLQLIYNSWISVGDDYKRSLKLDEMTICLWRIVFGSPEKLKESSEWSLLINPIKALTIEEEKMYFDDAYDEDILPNFMKLEESKLKESSSLSKFTINSSWIFKEISRHILESITTMDEADSLYVAMVSDT